jgi:hypothetical protein
MIEKFKNRRTVVVAFIAGLAIVVALERFPIIRVHTRTI